MHRLRAESEERHKPSRRMFSQFTCAGAVALLCRLPLKCMQTCMPHVYRRPAVCHCYPLLVLTRPCVVCCIKDRTCYSRACNCNHCTLIHKCLVLLTAPLQRKICTSRHASTFWRLQSTLSGVVADISLLSCRGRYIQAEMAAHLWRGVGYWSTQPIWSYRQITPVTLVCSLQARSLFP